MEWKWNRNGMKMDWYKVLMWIASMCLLVALVGERFLPQGVLVVLVLVGSGIMVAIVECLMDDKE